MKYIEVRDFAVALVLLAAPPAVALAAFGLELFWRAYL